MSAPSSPPGWLRLVGGGARNLLSTTRAVVTDLGTALATAGETLSDTIGGRRRGEGSLAVSVLILSDEDGPLCTPEDVLPALARADEIFRTDAGIRVRHAGTLVVTDPAPTQTLDPGANQQLLLDDVRGRTAFYTGRLPTPGAIGAPVTVVVVRRIAGNTTGCSLGMTADWVICEAALFDHSNENSCDDTVLAHELGHALNLPHHADRANLMYAHSSPPAAIRGTGLTSWQKWVLRTNRHTVPGVTDAV